MAKTHEHFLHSAQPTPTLLDIAPLSQRHEAAHKNMRGARGDEWRRAPQNNWGATHKPKA
ncbi:hypothetical protein HMPREF1640_00195 [Prevotella sp. S7-1-8]|nr:hypothetical protein HMPREF1640_00195 [Prevotella sp. S7-1-8]